MSGKSAAQPAAAFAISLEELNDINEVRVLRLGASSRPERCRFPDAGTALHLVPTSTAKLYQVLVFSTSTCSATRACRTSIVLSLF